MAATCKQMLGLLSKYAAMELEQVTKDMQGMLDKHPQQEDIQNFYKEMEGRLTKYEEEIKTKKKWKFTRDKIDYASGRILTFGRKYEVARKEIWTKGKLHLGVALSIHNVGGISFFATEPGIKTKNPKRQRKRRKQRKRKIRRGRGGKRNREAAWERSSAQQEKQIMGSQPRLVVATENEYSEDWNPVFNSKHLGGFNQNEELHAYLG